MKNKALIFTLILMMTGLDINAATNSSNTSGASSSTAGDETITGVQILTRSANVTCLSWQPIGVCVWITCTIYGCDIDYSAKVKHYSPDAVVSTYSVTGESPWTDTRGYAPATAIAQDGGTNKEGSTMINETSLLFKNADVIGSPGLLWMEALSSNGYFCDPTATLYFPYLLSTLDPTWRNPLIETPWTLLNLLRYVRLGLSSWGGVYPRGGFIHQGHDYKAGAVTAQRAADITTRKNQPHIYWPMVADTRADGQSTSQQGQWPPQEVIEGDAETHLWQQLIPETESSVCRVFPDISDQASGANDPFNARVNQIAGYSFNLWRPYRCCEQKGALLLFHTGN